jgi:hypothetical protein
VIVSGQYEFHEIFQHLQKASRASGNQENTLQQQLLS